MRTSSFTKALRAFTRLRPQEDKALKEYVDSSADFMENVSARIEKKREDYGTEEQYKRRLTGHGADLRSYLRK